MVIFLILYKIWEDTIKKKIYNEFEKLKLFINERNIAV